MYLFAIYRTESHLLTKDTLCPSFNPDSKVSTSLDIEYKITNLANKWQRNWEPHDSGIEMLYKEKHPFIKGRKKKEVQIEEDEQNDQSVTKRKKNDH